LRGSKRFSFREEKEIKAPRNIQISACKEWKEDAHPSKKASHKRPVKSNIRENIQTNQLRTFHPEEIKVEEEGGV